MAKFASRDVQLKIGANVVGQVTSLGPAGSSRDLIDASCYGDAFKYYVVGQTDGSEIEVGVSYDPANTQHIAMKTAYDAGTSTAFTILHAASSMSMAFNAMVTKFERGGERDGLLTLTATLKIIGSITG